jgi:hypothetical protein
MISNLWKSIGAARDDGIHRCEHCRKPEHE